MIENIVSSLILQNDVIGVAISQKLLLPYFSVKEQLLQSGNKQKLEQNLRQTLAKVPSTLDYLEFNVSEYFACAKHINNRCRLIILLINQNQNIFSSINHHINSISYLASVQKFQVNHLLDVHQDLLAKNSDHSSSKGLHNPLNMHASERVSEAISIDDFLCIANRLSDIVKDYLGAHITTNLWMETKPGYQYLNGFEINKHAQFEFRGNQEQIVTPTMHLGIKLWLNDFFERASTFIFNLPELIELACDEQNKSQVLSLIPATYRCKVGHIQNDDNCLFSNI